MRVCVVAYTFYESDTRVRRYAETLASRGDSVDVVALRQDGQSKCEAFRGVTLHRIQRRQYNERGQLTYLFRVLLFCLRSMFWLTKEHLKRHYDVVHVHSIPDFVVFAAWLPKLTGSMVILDIHDLVPEYYASKFNTSVRSVAGRLLLTIERASTAFADHVIAANHIWEKTLVARSVPAYKCTTILNYPDPSIFSRRGRARSDDRFIMLYPGTLSYHQGLDIAIKAFALIKDDVPEALFQIYGVGDQKEYLHRLVLELSLEDRVLIRGLLPAEEIAAVMENSDLGVVPKRSESFGNEAFSTKILEFMCLGVPLLIADTKIDRYYFDDTMVKFFRSGDEHDLAESMLRLIKDKALRDRLVRGAEEFIRENNWGVKKQIYLDILERSTQSEAKPATVEAQPELNLRGAPTNRAEDRMDAIVTQGWGRIAYNVVRSLGRQGLKVAVGTDEFLGMTYFSRYSEAAFRHPFFVSQPKEFVQSVKEAMRRYRPAVYLPSGQETHVVARYRNEFDGLGVEIPIAPFETLRKLHKKDELMNLARSLGIPTPETIVPRSAADIVDFAKGFEGPAVVKKVSSSGARGVYFLDRDSLSHLENGNSPIGKFTFGDVLTQQYVKGTGYGVSMLFNHGKLRAKFTHRRLREKAAKGGMSTLRTSVVNPVLEEYAERLLESVEFHGVAMVEFKLNELTNQAWLLEVNPRFWGSLALAIQSGVDFPFLLYRMAKEGDVSPVLDYEQGVRVRWILGDLYAILGHAGLATSSAANLNGVRHARGFDDFYWDDPLSFFAEAALNARKAIKVRVDSTKDRDFDITRIGR